MLESWKTVMCIKFCLLNQEDGEEGLKMLAQKDNKKGKIWLPENFL